MFSPCGSCAHVKTVNALNFSQKNKEPVKSSLPAAVVGRVDFQFLQADASQFTMGTSQVPMHTVHLNYLNICIWMD